MGCFAYLGQAMMTEEVIAALPDAEQALYENIPVWVTAAFAFAVWRGAAGSLLLLLRRKIATPVLVISVLGIITQMSYNLFMSDALEVYGTVGLIMPIMTLLIGVALVYFARFSTQNGWLR